MSDSLTPLEIETVGMIGQVWTNLCKIVGDGPSRSGDMRELVAHIHAIQQAIMSQAAARAYPEQFRPLGGTLRNDAPSDAIDS